MHTYCIKEVYNKKENISITSSAIFPIKLLFKSNTNMEMQIKIVADLYSISFDFHFSQISSGCPCSGQSLERTNAVGNNKNTNACIQEIPLKITEKKNSPDRTNPSDAPLYTLYKKGPAIPKLKIPEMILT